MPNDVALRSLYLSMNFDRTNPKFNVVGALLVPVNAVAWAVAVVPSWSFTDVVGPNRLFNELGGVATLSVSHADVLTEYFMF